LINIAANNITSSLTFAKNQSRSHQSVNETNTSKSQSSTTLSNTPSENNLQLTPAKQTQTPFNSSVPSLINARLVPSIQASSKTLLSNASQNPAIKAYQSISELSDSATSSQLAGIDVRF